MVSLKGKTGIENMKIITILQHYLENILGECIVDNTISITIIV